MYLTLAEYQEMGGELTGPAFSRLEFKARAMIDQATFGRLKADTAFSEHVRRLTFELIGLIGNLDVAAAGYAPQVASEENDGYGIRYSDGAILTVSGADKAAADLIERYLSGEKNQAGEPLLCRWA